MPVAIVDDGQIAYTHRGRGTALLLLPGLGCPRSIWQQQVERFSRTHQVIAVDPRGVGDSSPLRRGGTSWRVRPQTRRRSWTSPGRPRALCPEPGNLRRGGLVGPDGRTFVITFGD